MRDADRSHLQSVARATRRKLKTASLAKSVRFQPSDDLQIKGSGTGGWKVGIGTVVESGVEIQLWYDQFIGYPRRRLWVGLYSPDVRKIQTYANDRHVDVDDDDIIRNSQSNEWIVRKARQKIYFDKPILEKYRTHRGRAGYFGRYLISKTGRIQSVPVTVAANRASSFLEDILATPIESNTVTISPSRFRRALDRFQSRHVSEDGSPLKNFHDPGAYVVRTEAYKSAIPERARAVLKTASWTKVGIAGGDILSRVITAIELPRNNLLFWQAQYGPESAVHQPLKAALRSIKKRAALSDLFYRLFKQKKADQQTFDELIKYTGRRYELLSYLFFIAMPQKYLPLRTTHFDRALRHIGLDLQTRGNCNWENYQKFITVVGEVQRRLHAEGFPEASLLDAHSFLWILSQDQAKPEIKTGPPELHQFTGRFRMGIRTGDFSPDDEAAVRDMKREAEKRLASGEVAEEYAKNAEVNRLTRAKRKDLAAKVEILSDRPGLGYDIKSYDNDGRDRFIEVKNVTNGRRFFISEGEWVNSRKRKNYWFYLVNERNGRPVVTCFRAKLLERKHLLPVQHLVRF